MNRRHSAILHALAAVLLWSTVASAFKLTLRHTDRYAMLAGSVAISCAVLFVLAAAGGKLRSAFSDRRGLLRSAALGFLNPFLYYMLLFTAYDRLSAQEALALNYTWPVMLVLLAVPILRQPLTVRMCAALAVSFTGVVLVVTGGDVRHLAFSDPVGVATALASAVIWALYWLATVRDRRDETAKLFLAFLFGGIYCAAAWPFLGGSTRITLPAIAGMAYIGLFEMGITFLLWLRALRLTDSAARIGNLVFLSPFLSLIFVSRFVGERIAPGTVVGLAFIIAGILFGRRTAD